MTRPGDLGSTTSRLDQNSALWRYRRGKRPRPTGEQFGHREFGQSHVCQTAQSGAVATSRRRQQLREALGSRNRAQFPRRIPASHGPGLERAPSRVSCGYVSMIAPTALGLRGLRARRVAPASTRSPSAGRSSGAGPGSLPLCSPRSRGEALARRPWWLGCSPTLDLQCVLAARRPLAGPSSSVGRGPRACHHGVRISTP